MPKTDRVLRWLNTATVALILYSVLVVLVSQFCWVILAAVVYYRHYRRRSITGVQGTARFASTRDIPHLLRPLGGLPIGVMNGRAGKLNAALGLIDPRIPAATAVQAFLSTIRKPTGRSVYLNTSAHTLVCASSGAGKSVSLAIPFLLSSRDSAVVLDVKGELYRATFGVRRRLGPVAVLDPYNLVGGKDSYNVLDIDPESPYAMDDCRDNADAMIEKTDGSKDPYWDLAATDVLAAFIALMAAYGKGPARSLQGVLTALSNEKLFADSLEVMKDSGHYHGLLARAGHQIAGINSKQLASVKAVVHKSLSFLNTPAVAGVTGHVSTFDPAMLRHECMTIYMVIPPERLRAQAGLLRMWVTVFARAAIRGGLA